VHRLEYYGFFVEWIDRLGSPLELNDVLVRQTRRNHILDSRYSILEPDVSDPELWCLHVTVSRAPLDATLGV
jgi:hypothetical protein